MNKLSSAPPCNHFPSNFLSEEAGITIASGEAVSAGQKARVHDVNFAALIGFNSALFDDSFADLLAKGGSEGVFSSDGEEAGEDGEENKDLSEFHGLDWERICYKLINCL